MNVLDIFLSNCQHANFLLSIPGNWNLDFQISRGVSVPIFLKTIIAQIFNMRVRGLTPRYGLRPYATSYNPRCKPNLQFKFFTLFGIFQLLTMTTIPRGPKKFLTLPKGGRQWYGGVVGKDMSERYKMNR